MTNDKGQMTKEARKTKSELSKGNSKKEAGAVAGEATSREGSLGETPGAPAVLMQRSEVGGQRSEGKAAEGTGQDSGARSGLSTINSRLSTFRVRQGQREFERGVEEHRIAGLLARRQYGKTTIAARIALKKMMKRAGHTVIFGSVKLDLGREIVRKEAEAMQRAFSMMAAAAKKGDTLLRLADGSTGKEIATAENAENAEKQSFGVDDFAELYEACRLEFRLYHSRTVYSRTKVVALTPAAVGETGDLILDEVGRVKNFRDVYEAVKPIIASNPSFRCIYTTTPPPDDTHYSFELLAPPIGEELPVSAQGNWYRSELGVWVLRVTAWDAYADGIPLYDDDTGAAQSPDESRARDHDKDAWDRNYGCRFVMGGTAACGLMVLDTAQRRSLVAGYGCRCIFVETDLDMDRALAELRRNLGDGPVGIGVDVATTTKETSNPTSVTVMERIGVEKLERLVVLWKTKDPAVATARIRSIVEAIERKETGDRRKENGARGKARRLAIDATSERYFAEALRQELAGLVPVELVIQSVSLELPGQEEPISMKTHLGDLYVGELDDNHLTLPAERYVKEDHRMVRKDRGSYVCEPGGDGKHGDTFDSGKLANWALSSNAGALEGVEGIVQGGHAGRGRVIFRPRMLQRT